MTLRGKKNRNSHNAAVETVGDLVTRSFGGPAREIEFCAINVVRDGNGTVDRVNSRAEARSTRTTTASTEILDRVTRHCVEELELFEHLVSLVGRGTHRLSDHSLKLLEVQFRDPFTGDASKPLQIIVKAAETPHSVRTDWLNQYKEKFYNRKAIRNSMYQAMVAEVDRRGWRWSDFDRRRGKGKLKRGRTDERWREICRAANPLWITNELTDQERVEFANTSRDTILRYLRDRKFVSDNFSRTRTTMISSTPRQDKVRPIRKTSKRRKRNT